MQIQKEFAALVAATDGVCRRRFGNRLAAAYVAGSVARGEAWPGASDLDWFVFLHEEPTTLDKAWRRRRQRALQARFRVAGEVHLNVNSVERLRRESFWRFILRYNALRIRGSSVLAQLERQGHRVPRPGRELAKSRLPFVRQCLSEALAGRCPPAFAEMPSDPFLATRKLARNFVIVEGAYVLMCRGAFKSFGQGAVLHGLRRVRPSISGLLDTTAAILADPYQAKVKPKAFMRQVRSFVEWAVQWIEEV